MNATIEDTLLNLFQQVTDSLEKLPGLVEISLPLIRAGASGTFKG